MTDLRRSSDVGRIHQQASFGDSFRSSCNTTPVPEPKPGTLTNGHSLMQHANMESPSEGSGSSTTSSTATTATMHPGGRQCNGNGHSEAAEDRGSYYLSPTKRKASLSHVGSTMLLRGREPFRSFSPTAATVAPSYPPVTPSSAYGARAAGEAHDFSFDSCEVSSHYSDTPMQGLRSGSCSAVAVAGGASSSSFSNLNVATAMTQRSQNNVTFSNVVRDERRERSQLTRGGSLRRHKGRSNQSLCSCDVGEEAEINLDPSRPLYEYSLEQSSGQKRHTYTCEQNAQILLRLERERNRKLSLGAVTREESQSDTNTSSDMEAIPPVPPPPAIKRNGSVRSLRLIQQQFQQQQQQRTSSGNNNNNNMALSTLCNGGDILNDCTSGALEIGSAIDDCTSSILKCANGVGSELMAAATSAATGSLAGERKGSQVATVASMVSHSKPDVCHVGNLASTSFNAFNPPLNSYVDDDIFAPTTRKLDPSLCFLHAGPNGVVGPGPDLSASQRDLGSSWRSLSKYNTIGPTTDYARQLAWFGEQQQQHDHIHQEQQQQQHYPRRIADRCRCLSQSLSTFPRNYFGQQQQRSSSSLALGLSLGLLGRNGDVDGDFTKFHIFHAASDERDWINDNDNGTAAVPPASLAPIISRSYSNLVDIDGRRLRHPKNFETAEMEAPANVFSSNCSFGVAANLLNNASFSTLKSSTSGLKEKLHQKNYPFDHHHHLHHGLHPLYKHKSQAMSQQQLHPQRHHLEQQSHQHQQLSQQLQHPKHHHQQLHSSVTSIMPWKHRQCPSRGSSSSGTNSFRFDAAKHWLAVSSILLIIGAASVAVPLALRVAASAPFEERLRVALQLLDQVPLIDGHNDLPWNIRKFLHNKLNDFNFDEDLRSVMPWARSHWSHTDLQRLKKGRVSAQFWAAYVPCEAQHRDAVQLTLEQIDVIKRLTDRYSPQLTTCTSSDDIIAAHKNHQLCSLTGVEGGHSLGGSLAVLRTLYAIGVRYVTLTSTCHTPWADSSYADAPTFNVKHGGLTLFGKTIIREMNRLGMMVDLSHVSTGTMRDALEVSEAPVIFSHSSAYEVCNSSRNVQDDMLQSLTKNGGIIMVNFYSKFLSCSENATVQDAVAHINHIKRVAGIDHVGLGAGYDGINFTPKGLEDVSSYPTIFAELLGGGWSIEDLTKLAGGNFLRVMQQVEKIRDEKRAAGVKPFEDQPSFRTEDPYNCTSS